MYVHGWFRDYFLCGSEESAETDRVDNCTGKKSQEKWYCSVKIQQGGVLTLILTILLRL